MHFLYYDRDASPVRAVKGGERAMDQALTISVRYHVAHVLITVAGEIDITTVPQLRGQLTLLAAGGRPVIADLTGVTFIDVAGLRVLAGAAGKAAASGGSLHVVSGRYQVQRIFALTGLDRQIPLARTRAEALAALPAGRDIRANGNSRRPARRAPAGTAHKHSDHGYR